MRLLKKKETPVVSYNEKYLMDEINMTKLALETAYSNFENATDPDLIDCYIYKVNSEQKRYQYLLARAKEFETL
ncbi:MAG: YaaL family protein [Lachnospira sp.]|nr:YaaL family protein [Lachnospira sp.]